ncbi:MAG TPA: pseudouridine synthase [Patescibacteria group bacterium]|jgi:23S rRNA pseudouridine2605 synthase|nr:pseudouridine synthase [Patescibacteria group bacterium]
MKKQSSVNPLPSLTKYIAQAGICSRRKAVQLIQDRSVLVNNSMVTEGGYRVKSTDMVVVKGEPIRQPKKVYILLNKPKDYITTSADEKGRKIVTDLVAPHISERVYPVGRLDRSTTGLLFLTNDGELAQRLSHPRYKIAKVYHITLNASLTHQDFTAIKEGVQLYDGLVTVDYIEYMHKKCDIIIEIHSGKNRVIRRLFEHFGYQVKKLDRIQYAGLTKTGLTVGNWRFLTASEVHALKNPNTLK